MFSLKSMTIESLTLASLSKKLNISEDKLLQFEADKYLLGPAEVLKLSLIQYDSNKKEIGSMMKEFSNTFQDKTILALKNSTRKNEPAKFVSELNSLVLKYDSFSNFKKVKSNLDDLAKNLLSTDKQFKTFQARINGMLRRELEEKAKLEAYLKDSRTKHNKLQKKLEEIHIRTETLSREKEKLEENINHLTSQIADRSTEIDENSYLITLETYQYNQKLKEQSDLMADISSR